MHRPNLELGTRFSRLFAAAVGLALLPSPSDVPAAKEAESSRPNVLLVTIDDLRDVHNYDPVVKILNMDRVAAQGVRFDRAYVQATFCNPSRISFLTGLRTDTTGIYDNGTKLRSKHPNCVTMPQLFRENGYYTYSLGKVFHSDKGDPKSWDRFERPGTTRLGRRGEGRNLSLQGQLDFLHWRAAEGTDEDQPDGASAQLAVEFIEGEHERPFFLAVGFRKPHDPYVAPKEYFDPYPLESLPPHRDPPDLSPTPHHHMGIGGFYKVKHFEAFTERDQREFLRAYFAGTTFMDAQLGKVLDALDRTGLAKNTVVVVLSDHGYHLGERQWWNKSTLYEYSARSPLIVSAPGRKAKGAACERLVEFVDVFPTLAELCDLTPPARLDGRSLVPLLDDPKQPWSEAAFTVQARGDYLGRSIRTERYRYIEWRDPQGQVELFDHCTDPAEFHNLANDPEYAEVVAKLRELLRKNRPRPLGDD
jgi:uncharacterized sulfatase